MKVVCWLLAGHLVATLAGSAQWDSSCTKEFLNNGYRNCCLSSGLCQDSSCTVFGFKSSAKSNCAVTNGVNKCPTTYCGYVVDSCPTASDGNHCWGYVKCTDGSTTCTNYGALCLEDGNSQNYKICGSSSCNNDRDCTGTDICVKTGTGQNAVSECTAVSPSPSPSPTGITPAGSCVPCLDAYRTNTCKRAENKEVGSLVVDAPNWNADALVTELKKNGYLSCERDPTGCDLIVCDENIKDTSFFTSCKSTLINSDGSRSVPVVY